MGIELLRGCGGDGAKTIRSDLLVKPSAVALRS
jgi:hypothetical protein